MCWEPYSNLLPINGDRYRSFWTPDMNVEFDNENTEESCNSQASWANSCCDKLVSKMIKTLFQGTVQKKGWENTKYYNKKSILPEFTLPLTQYQDKCHVPNFKEEFGESSAPCTCVYHVSVRKDNPAKNAQYVTDLWAVCQEEEDCFKHCTFVKPMEEDKIDRFLHALTENDSRKLF